MFAVAITGEDRNLLEVNDGKEKTTIECSNNEEAQARMFELIDEHCGK